MEVSAAARGQSLAQFLTVGVAGGMQKGLKKYFVNMDEYLTSLGFYRKMVARDASSLFRAVSEQVSGPEGQHGRSVGTKELAREVW